MKTFINAMERPIWLIDCASDKESHIAYYIIRHMLCILNIQIRKMIFKYCISITLEMRASKYAKILTKCRIFTQFILLLTTRKGWGMLRLATQLNSY